MDRGLFRYYRLLLLFLISGPVLLPLWATVIGGFKTTGDLRTNAFGLPREWIVDNYVEILTGQRFWQMLGNSAIIALVSTVLTVLVSSMAAFTLSHMHFAGRKFIGNYLALGPDLSLCHCGLAGLHTRPRFGVARHLLGRDPPAGSLSTSASRW